MTDIEHLSVASIVASGAWTAFKVTVALILTAAAICAIGFAVWWWPGYIACLVVGAVLHGFVLGWVDKIIRYNESAT